VMIGTAFETLMEVVSRIVAFVVVFLVRWSKDKTCLVVIAEYRVSSVLRVRDRELDAWRKDGVRACLSKGYRF
jgi:hypothetical protein